MHNIFKDKSFYLQILAPGVNQIHFVDGELSIGLVCWAVIRHMIVRTWSVGSRSKQISVP